MTDDYNSKFEAMTENMAIEQIYDQLAERAEMMKHIVRHSSEIWKEAVEVGLPKAVADRLVLKYFDFETAAPPGVTVIEIDERDETL